MSEFTNFRNKTIREIRIWAWLAAVLPLVSLAGLFFIWLYGSKTSFNIAMVIGETTMFAVAVVWWWWAIYVIKTLVLHWEATRGRVAEVLDEIRSIKGIVRETISNPNDK